MLRKKKQQKKEKKKIILWFLDGDFIISDIFFQKSKTFTYGQFLKYSLTEFLNVTFLTKNKFKEKNFTPKNM